MSDPQVRALIVDDDALVLDDLRRLLERLGYVVVGEAANGAQALELAFALRPDVILMDIEMPKMDGVAAAQQIQASCPTPIVFLSAHDSHAKVQQAASVGVGGYLTKPPSAPALQRAITIARALHGDLMRLREVGEALSREVSDRRQAEERLAIAKEEAEAADRAKGAFLAAMSHEVRTPLNGVVGALSLLADTPLSSAQRRLLEMAIRSADGLLGVMNGILDYSKMESGALEMELDDVSLRAVLESAIAAVAPRAAASAIELLCSLDPRAPALVRGDAVRITQILTNLSSNAVKFTERGEVTISIELAGPSDAGRAAAPGERAGARRVSVHFSVRDTGIGLRPDERERIFRPFAQGSATTHRRYGGTGLGLSICKRLVDGMGGQIGVESAPGEGSTFWFTLPLAVSDEPPGAAPSADGAGAAGLRALVVDDNAASRAFMTEKLGYFRLHVESAPDGPTALQMARGAIASGSPFGALVIDRDMPGADGIELARALRAEASEASLQPTIVLLTSLDDPIELDVAREAGVDVCLNKPALPLDIYAALSGAGWGARPGARGGDARAAATDGPSLAAPISVVEPALRRRLLLVEDSEMSQMVARAMLEARGYEVDVAADGLEALDAVRRVPYDLILMDCQMPGMDGLTATIEIRRREEGGRRTPIIALTANAAGGEREACLAVGMDDFLAKPIVKADLYRAVERWLARGRIALGVSASAG